MKILVPDFYKSFKCKCGDCRHVCCQGWGITLSFKEYCKVMGLDCSEDLRRKLDCAFFVLPDATNERYAKVKLNWCGHCNIQREDGLCALQKECGEDVLPSICRLYPRSVRSGVLDEGTLANSCEGVVELLFNKEDHLHLIEIDCSDTLDIPNDEECFKSQKQALQMLQNSTYSLDERLIKLGKSFGLSFANLEITNQKLIFADLLDLIHHLEDYSDAFSQYSIISKEDMGVINSGINEDYVYSRYSKAKNDFIKRFPSYELFFENIFNNHIIYERFPYSSEGLSKEELYLELCGVYALTRFVVVAYCENHHKEEDLIDCVSSLFRCFEHSSANEIIRIKLREMGKNAYPFIVAAIKTL